MLRRRRLLGVEEVDQVAVDTEPGFHQGGSGGAEREQDQEDEAADSESGAQEAAREHLPHGERAAARGGGFGGEGAALWIWARGSTRLECGKSSAVRVAVCGGSLIKKDNKKH